MTKTNKIIIAGMLVVIAAYLADKFIVDWTPVWNSYTAEEQALDCDMNAEYYTINNNTPAYCK